MELIGSWTRHARRMAPDVDRTDLEIAGLEVLARYEEPHRRFHDRRHLAEVLAGAALLAEHARDLSAVMLAAWWHDAIHGFDADDDTEASATLASATLAAWGADPDRALHVGDLIRATRTHDPAEYDADGQVLCDADLAVLASPPARYVVHAADLRAEHLHLDDGQFRQIRTAQLQTLVCRERIYRTPSAHERWETDARTNIQTELARLGA